MKWVQLTELNGVDAEFIECVYDSIARANVYITCYGFPQITR